jgi:hypothetical protein
MFRAIVHKQILFVTVNRGERAVREVHPWRSLPEIEAIVLTAIEVFHRLFKTMIMYLVRARVGLGELYTNKDQVRTTGVIAQINSPMPAQ